MTTKEALEVAIKCLTEQIRFYASDVKHCVRKKDAILAKTRLELLLEEEKEKEKREKCQLKMNLETAKPYWQKP